MRYAYRVRHFCRLMTFVVAACVTVHAAGQAGSSPEIENRLKRVATDLFSAFPHPAEAIQELKSILSAEPNVAEAHMLLGIAYRAQGIPELMGEAVAELRQAIALKPSLAFARMTLARVYLDMSRATRAKEELQTALEQMPGNPQLLSLLGQTERELGNPRRSVELQRQALAADPTDMQARYYLGLALLDVKQPADAIRELKQVVQSGASPGESSLALGAAYLAAGQVNEAIAALRESARVDPGRADTHIQLARAYRTKGLLSEAEKQLKLAMPSAKSGLSALYSSVQTDLYMEEGLIRMQQGKLEAAAESFQKVLNADANHAEAKQRLAEVQKRLKTKTPPKNPGAAW